MVQDTQGRAWPVCFYGDDFTGATAHLAGFHDAGLRALLFLRTPDEPQLAAHLGELDVLGIAGTARSLSPADMRPEVLPALELFKRLGSRQIQYKVCSTFDSAPLVGSIGSAIEMGREVFGTADVPVAAADPRLGRYTVFGNHFALSGKDVFRLDRHPSMSRHPSTPMAEADLCRHLEKQTRLPGGLVDIVAVRSGGAARRWAELTAAGKAFTVFDSLEDSDLDAIAKALWEAGAERPLFAVSSQGLAAAFGRLMAAQAPDRDRSEARAPGDVDRMLVLSGSAATQNSQQIAAAIAAGWLALRLDVAALFDGSACEKLRADLVQSVQAGLDQGRSVLVYTAQGPADPALDEVRQLQSSRAISGDAVARAIGSTFAQVATSAVRKGLRRLVLAGGDTSSYAMRHIDAYALRIAAAGRHGGRLCRVLSADHDIDGLEVMLKGGQVGNAGAFVDAASASAWKS